MISEITINDAATVAAAVAKSRKVNFTAQPVATQNEQARHALAVARLIACDGRNPEELTEAEQDYVLAWEALAKARGGKLGQIPSNEGSPAPAFIDLPEPGAAAAAAPKKERKGPKGKSGENAPAPTGDGAPTPPPDATGTKGDDPNGK